MSRDEPVQDENDYDGIGWAGFQLVGAGGASGTGGIAAVSRASSSLEVLYVNSDGSIQDEGRYDGGSWSGVEIPAF